VPKNDGQRIRGYHKVSPNRIPVHKGRTKTIQIFVDYGEMFLPSLWDHVDGSIRRAEERN